MGNGREKMDKIWDKKAWNDKTGLLGIYIHNLKNSNGDQSNKGSNPLEAYTVDGTSMANIVKAYNPPYLTSAYIYDHTKENLANWIEQAIDIRGKYDWCQYWTNEKNIWFCHLLKCGISAQKVSARYSNHNSNHFLSNGLRVNGYAAFPLLGEARKRAGRPPASSGGSFRDPSRQTQARGG